MRFTRPMPGQLRGAPAPLPPRRRAATRRRPPSAGARRSAVERHCAADVAGLEGAEALLVAVVHDLVAAGGMVEADGVADLVGQRVAQVVGLEVAVEADLPGLRRIEADQRLGDRLDRLGRPGLVEHVSEGPAVGLGLGADQDIGRTAVGSLLEDDVGRRLPHGERGRHLGLDRGRRQPRAGGEPVERGEAAAVAGGGELYLLCHQAVGDDAGATADRQRPADLVPLQLENPECLGLLGGERGRQRGAQQADNGAGEAQRHGWQGGVPRFTRLVGRFPSPSSRCDLRRRRQGLQDILLSGL